MNQAQHIKTSMSTDGFLSLDLTTINSDRLLFIDVKTEDGYKICDGLFGENNNKFSCSLNKTLLKHGDNALILTFFSADQSVEYIKTVQHYFYDGSLEKENMSFQVPPNVLLLCVLIFIGGVVLYSRYRKPVTVLPIIPIPLHNEITKMINQNDDIPPESEGKTNDHDNIIKRRKFKIKEYFL
eukprot:gene12882-17261_t